MQPGAKAHQRAAPPPTAAAAPLHAVTHATTHASGSAAAGSGAFPRLVVGLARLLQLAVRDPHAPPRQPVDAEHHRRADHGGEEADRHVGLEDERAIGDVGHRELVLEGRHLPDAVEEGEVDHARAPEDEHALQPAARAAPASPLGIDGDRGGAQLGHGEGRDHEVAAGAVRQDERDDQEHRVVEEDDGVAEHLRQEDDEVGDAVRGLQQDGERLGLRQPDARVRRRRRRRLQQQAPVVPATVPRNDCVQAHRDRDEVVQEAHRVPHPRGHVGSRAALLCAQHETADHAQQQLDDHVRSDHAERDDVLAQEPLERVVRERLGQVQAGVGLAVQSCLILLHPRAGL
eukprot:CAMPEP_0118828592 /NCGR_PEP_ID=MMETSP1162-20130426/18998_1 /TAXON_ID=33656 /ORGANISM="Phaeocystis Sp, Strain CCMP2710" /LENGTH=344 /DNA_ID=CAMNT_0006759621 /DNA_START=66 /DNA_END=1099 /DNA_ORIENTATION=+